MDDRSAPPSAPQPEVDGQVTDHGVPTSTSRLAMRLCIAGVGAFAAFCVSIFVVHAWQNPSWLIGIFEQHFAATVGAPLGMVAALMIITVFRHQAGPIEFEIFTLKFRGAAGPAIMWIAVFLSIVLGIKVLW